MADEVMQELWKTKDNIARECDYSFEKLLMRIHNQEKEHGNTVAPHGRREESGHGVSLEGDH